MCMAGYDFFYPTDFRYISKWQKLASKMHIFQFLDWFSSFFLRFSSFFSLKTCFAHFKRFWWKNFWGPEIQKPQILKNFTHFATYVNFTSNCIYNIYICLKNNVNYPISREIPLQGGPKSLHYPQNGLLWATKFNKTDIYATFSWHLSMFMVFEFKSSRKKPITWELFYRVAQNNIFSFKWISK